MIGAGGPAPARRAARRASSTWPRSSSRGEDARCRNGHQKPGSATPRRAEHEGRGDVEPLEPPGDGAGCRAIRRWRPSPTAPRARSASRIGFDAPEVPGLPLVGRNLPPREAGGSPETHGDGATASSSDDLRRAFFEPHGRAARPGGAPAGRGAGALGGGAGGVAPPAPDPLRGAHAQGAPLPELSEPGRTRCRFHGGRSTGPKTAEDKARIAEAQRLRWARWQAAREARDASERRGRLARAGRRGPTDPEEEPKPPRPARRRRRRDCPRDGPARPRRPTRPGRWRVSELCVWAAGPSRPRDRSQPPSGLKRSSNMMANWFTAVSHPLIRPPADQIGTMRAGHQWNPACPLTRSRSAWRATHWRAMAASSQAEGAEVPVDDRLVDVAPQRLGRLELGSRSSARG